MLTEVLAVWEVGGGGRRRSSPGPGVGFALGVVFCVLPASSPWTRSVTDARDRGRCNDRGKVLDAKCHASSSATLETASSMTPSQRQGVAGAPTQIRLENTESWLRTNGVNTNKVTAKVLFFDGFGESAKNAMHAAYN